MHQIYGKGENQLEQVLVSREYAEALDSIHMAFHYCVSEWDCVCLPVQAVSVGACFQFPDGISTVMF